MRVPIVFCDECGETWRLAPGERPDRRVLASLLVGRGGEHCYDDDLALIHAGWHVQAGKHLCPDCTPTVPPPPPVD